MSRSEIVTARLRDLRITGSRAAQAIGKTKQQWSSYVSRPQPRPATLRRVALALALPVELLFDGADPALAAAYPVPSWAWLDALDQCPDALTWEEFSQRAAEWPGPQRQ